MGQRDEEVVHGFSKELQILIHYDAAYFRINESIQNLCLLYFYQLIDTKISTYNEQEIFMDLLTRTKKPKFGKYEWKLLYRTSKDCKTNA